MIRLYCRLFGHLWRPFGFHATNAGWVCCRCHRLSPTTRTPQ